jgi:hypothetical protein
VQIYKKFSKVGLSLCLATVLPMVSSCGANISENTNFPQKTVKNDASNLEKNNTLVDTFKDWTYNRVDPKLRKQAFSTKSSADTLKPAPGIITPTEVGLITSKIAGGRYHTVTACLSGTNLNEDPSTFPVTVEEGCNVVDPVPETFAPVNLLQPKIFDFPSYLEGDAVGEIPVDELDLQDKLYLAEDTVLDPELKVGETIRIDETGESFTIKAINTADVLGAGDKVFASDKLEISTPYPGTVDITKGGMVVHGTDTEFTTAMQGQELSINFPGSVQVTAGGVVVTGINTKFKDTFGPFDLTGAPSDVPGALGVPQNRFIIIHGDRRRIVTVDSDTTLTTEPLDPIDIEGTSWPVNLAKEAYLKEDNVGVISRAYTNTVAVVNSATSLTVTTPWQTTLSKQDYFRYGAGAGTVTATTITLDREPETPISNAEGSNISVISTKTINGSNTNLSGSISTTAGSKTVTGSFGVDFGTQINVGDTIVVEETGEVIVVASVNNDPFNPSFTTVNKVNSSFSNSRYKLQIPKNTRAKSFGATSLYPVVDTVNNILYFTSNNTSGSNFFAVKANGDLIWEHNFEGGFWGNSPTITPKTHLSKRIMYLAGKEGNIYAINTDGVLAASFKINDKFKDTSLVVDSSDSTFDYVYATSQSGTIYRLKLDFSNPQVKTFTQVYSSKVTNASFSASPVFDGSAIYVGAENGELFEIIPNTGQAARSWDLSLYPRNGSARISASAYVGLIPAGKVILIPAGGYLYRIVGSTVTQSPLLELKNGLNSRNVSSGSVFTTASNPTGTIKSSPVVMGTKAYISNSNAIFESDFSSIDAFNSSANYCVSIAGRVDDSNTNLLSLGNGNIDLSPSGNGDGSFKAAMVDLNTSGQATANINFFSVPLNPGVDSLVRFLPLNEFDSNGYPLSGENASAVADGTGRVYFTLNNGTVNVLIAP